MMLGRLPACSAPTVTTAVSPPATSRDTTVCSRSTVAAAITTGSTVASGLDPCPPRAVQGDPQAVGGREGRPGAQPDHPGGDRRDVLPEHDVGAGHPVVQPVGDHRRRAAAHLLGRLEQRHDRP